MAPGLVDARNSLPEAEEIAAHDFADIVVAIAARQEFTRNRVEVRGFAKRLFRQRTQSHDFEHADWGHIIFNLIFFFAFAATVEAIASHLAFAAYVLVISIIIGVTDSVTASLADAHHWTLGLSGVVAGMMGMFAYLLPHGKIRVYYWFIIIFGSIAVPGWILALWYIGGDVYQLFTYDEHGGINVLAHVTGGIAGYFYGFFFLKKARQRAVNSQRVLDHSKLLPGT